MFPLHKTQDQIKYFMVRTSHCEGLWATAPLAIMRLLLNAKDECRIKSASLPFFPLPPRICIRFIARSKRSRLLATEHQLVKQDSNPKVRRQLFRYQSVATA
jgi:hypothetical protein